MPGTPLGSTGRVPGQTYGRLSAASLVALARRAGFGKQDAVTMAAIAEAESGGDPGAHNYNPSTGDDSWGLWQVNMLGSLGAPRRAEFGLSSDDQLAQPEVNIKAARQIYADAGNSFSPWSTYGGGHGSFTNYLGTAADGEKQVEADPNRYLTGSLGGALVADAKGAVQAALSPVTDAAGKAASAVADKVIGAATPILWKGLFVALGVGLLGAGVVKAFDVKLPSLGGGAT